MLTLTFMESIVLGTCITFCASSVGWLLYDMDKQLKAYKKALEESTLGLVEDEEE